MSLVFNTLAVQDNQNNLAMAHGMRKDSAIMKTIAGMTSLFLPATFVSSLFGTNFFSLQVSDSGFATLYVSDLWWILVVTVVPLTLGVWLFWLWYSSHHLQKKIYLAPKEHDIELGVLQKASILAPELSKKNL